MSKLFEKMQKDRAERAERKAAAQRRTVPLSKHTEILIRLFPHKDSADELNFMDFGQHFVRESATGKPSVVSCITMSNPEHVCPVCNAYAQAHGVLRDRNLDPKTNPEMKNLESAKPTRRILWAGKYVTKSLGDGKYEWSETVVFEIPVTAFEQICDHAMSLNENADKDAFSKEDGFAFKVNKSGSGMNTEYKVTPVAKITCPLSDDDIQNQQELSAFVTDMTLADMMTCVARLNKIAGVSRPTTAESLQLPETIFIAIGGGKAKPAIEDKALTSAAASLERATPKKTADSVDDIDDIDLIDAEISAAMGEDVVFSKDEMKDIDQEAQTPPLKTDAEIDDLLDSI